MLRILAVLFLACVPAAASAQDGVSWSFDKRLSDVETRLGAVEKALGIRPAAPPPKAAAPAANPKAAAVAVHRSTPRVYDPLAGVWVTGSGGSGVVVWTDGTKSLVATAKHVTPDPGTGLSVTAGGVKYPAKLALALHDVDLAILEVAAGLPAAPGADRGPDLAAPLAHFGGSTGGGTGRMLGWQTLSGFPYAVADYDSESGDSGAGVFDQQGRVVGVHCGRVGNPPEQRRYFVSASVVRNAVNDVLAGKAAAPPQYRLAPAGGGYCPTGTCPLAR